MKDQEKAKWGNKWVKTHGPCERKEEDIMSLEMRNDHYGVRKKARKHGKWGMKQDSAAWKFRTKKYDGIIYSDFEY